MDSCRERGRLLQARQVPSLWRGAPGAARGNRGLQTWIRGCDDDAGWFRSWKGQHGTLGIGWSFWAAWEGNW